MPLVIGSRLGPYEILATAGVGGMGEVYRARDTRLDRTVAIKVLPPHIATQPEARARFEREARAVSSLNHPHICALFDIGREGEVDYIVMEFLEGETLAQRISRGPLPIPQARRFAAEAADALDRAHRKGVVHRDLKPANIMLTQDGVKLLDFGIAKSRPVKIGPSDDTLQALTGQGTLLGTPQYMSPEQLQGQDADTRSDIFGLGCMLYEMIAGRRAFDGTNPGTVIASIIAGEPRPLEELQPATPPSLRRLVKTCLAKEPDNRWQSARDIQLLLEAPDEPEVVAAAAASRRLPWVAAAAILAVAAASILGFALSRKEPVAAEAYRLNLTPPQGSRFRHGGGPQGGTAFSRDGRTLAFVAVTDGRSSLWLRALDSGQTRVLAGTEEATQPFWSPDGKSIGFFAEGKLKRVDVAGGAEPRTLCDVSRPSGGTWNPDGVILFSARGLYRVSANGGAPAALLEADPKIPGPSHQWPQFLSDGNRFLYWGRAERGGGSLHVASLANPKSATPVAGPQGRVRVIPPAEGRPAFLVWVRDGALIAQAFDEAALKLSGEPIPLAEGMGSGPGPASGDFAVAASGAVLFGLPGVADEVLALWERDGKESEIVGPAGDYGTPRFSPDGGRVVYTKLEAPSSRDLWITDLKRGLATRFTFERPPEFSAVWSPDGRRIAFTRGPPRPAIFLKSAAGAENEEVLAEGGESTLTDWSRDGRILVYNSRAQGPGRTDFDLRMLPLEGDRKPVAILETNFDERDGQLSPNGRFLAYVSNESGRHEVYVRTFPSNTGKWQVSSAGGVHVLWSSNGRELFYVSEDSKLMAATLRTEGSAFVLEAPPAPLFSFPGYSTTAPYSYDVAPDGKRFVVIRPSELAGGSLTILLNWWTGSAP